MIPPCDSVLGSKFVDMLQVFVLLVDENVWDANVVFVADVC